MCTCAVRNCLECKERSRLGSWLRCNEESSLSPRASHLVSLIKGAHSHFKLHAQTVVTTKNPLTFSLETNVHKKKSYRTAKICRLSVGPFVTSTDCCKTWTLIGWEPLYTAMWKKPNRLSSCRLQSFILCLSSWCRSTVTFWNRLQLGSIVLEPFTNLVIFSFTFILSMLFSSFDRVIP